MSSIKLVAHDQVSDPGPGEHWHKTGVGDPGYSFDSPRQIGGRGRRLDYLDSDITFSFAF